MELHLNSMPDGYADIASEILRRGDIVSPRGQKTREIRGATIHLLDPGHALPVSTGRAVVPAIGAMEFLQMAAGISDLEALVAVAPHFSQFADDGILKGAYGPRLSGQLEDAIDKIKADQDTRQAVVTIWDPYKDNLEGHHDYPCTITLGWMIRNKKLEAFTSMRSNDCWLGVPYDFFIFTQLQMTIANILGIEAGPYHHHAWSLHLYEKHWEAASNLNRSSDPGPPAVGLNAASWPSAAFMAIKLFKQSLQEDTPNILSTPSEYWYVDVIRRQIAKNKK